MRTAIRTDAYRFIFPVNTVEDDQTRIPFWDFIFGHKDFRCLFPSKPSKTVLIEIGPVSGRDIFNDIYCALSSDSSLFSSLFGDFRVDTKIAYSGSLDPFVKHKRLLHRRFKEIFEELVSHMRKLLEVCNPSPGPSGTKACICTMLLETRAYLAGLCTDLQKAKKSFGVHISPCRSDSKGTPSRTESTVWSDETEFLTCVRNYKKVWQPYLDVTQAGVTKSQLVTDVLKLVENTCGRLTSDEEEGRLSAVLQSSMTAITDAIQGSNVQEVELRLRILKEGMDREPPTPDGPQGAKWLAQALSKSGLLQKARGLLVKTRSDVVINLDLMCRAISPSDSEKPPGAPSSSSGTKRVGGWLLLEPTFLECIASEPPTGLLIGRAGLDPSLFCPKFHMLFASLTALHLSGCGLSLPDATGLAMCLQHLTQLRLLDVSDNLLDADATCRIVCGLSVLMHEKMHLSKGIDGLLAMADAAASQQSADGHAAATSQQSADGHAAYYALLFCCKNNPIWLMNLIDDVDPSRLYASITMATMAPNLLVVTMRPIQPWMSIPVRKAILHHGMSICCDFVLDYGHQLPIETPLHFRFGLADAGKFPAPCELGKDAVAQAWRLSEHGMVGDPSAWFYDLGLRSPGHLGLSNTYHSWDQLFPGMLNLPRGIRCRIEVHADSRASRSRNECAESRGSTVLFYLGIDTRMQCVFRTFLPAKDLTGHVFAAELATTEQHIPVKLSVSVADLNGISSLIALERQYGGAFSFNIDGSLPPALVGHHKRLCTEITSLYP